MRSGLLAALVVLVACSSGKDTHSAGIADGTYAPNDVTLIAPSNTLGTITGQVIDSTGTPISGVAVKAALGAGPQTSNTDANGAFAFTKVPGGTTVGLTFSKSGYTSAYATTTLADSAGNVPEDNTNAFVGPVQLFATTGTLAISVVAFDGTQPNVSGVGVVSPAFGLSGFGAGESYLGSTSVTATSAGGTLTFSGIPDLQQLAALGSGVATLAVAIDPSTSGSASYGGATLYLTVTSALSSPGLLSVVLPDSSQGAADLAVIGSPCGSLVSGPGAPTDSLVPSGSPVAVAFNQPVFPQTVGVTLLKDDGTSELATVTPGSSPNIISFADSDPAGFQPGAGYQVTLQATSSNSHPETAKTFTGYIFTQPNEGSPTLTHAYFTPGASGTLAPGSVVSVGFDSPVGVAGGSPVLAAYFDTDISFPPDNKRTLVGEYDSTGVSKAGGWQLTPNPKFPIINGFSANFVFTYTGQASLTPNKPVLVLYNDPLTPGSTSLEWMTGLPLNVANSPGQGGEVALAVAPHP